MRFMEDLELLNYKTRNDSLKKYIDKLEGDNDSLRISLDKLEKEHAKLIEDSDHVKHLFMHEILELNEKITSLQSDLLASNAEGAKIRDKYNQGQKLIAEYFPKYQNGKVESQTTIDDINDLFKNLSIYSRL